MQVPAAKGTPSASHQTTAFAFPSCLRQGGSGRRLDLGTVDLGYGRPVYGHIRANDGEGVEGAVVTSGGGNGRCWPGD